MAYIDVKGTDIDKIFYLLESKKKMSISKLAKKVKYSESQIENIAKLFEKRRIVDIEYNIMGSPTIKLLKKIPLKETEELKGKVIEEYNLNVNDIEVNVKLYSYNDSYFYYYIFPPKIGQYTKIFLEELREDVAEDVPIEMSDITDPKKTSKIKERFFEAAKKHLSEYFQEEYLLKILSNELLHMMYGLGKLDYIMEDQNLEEIAINSAKTPVIVYHRKLGWMLTNIYIESEDVIANYAAQIGRKVGRDITALNPILDAHLSGGDRVNATLMPISSSGNTITIRRYLKRPWTVIDYVGKLHTMDYDMSALLWMAMQYELNIIVAGGTASGKTTTLNALSAFIPSNQRIISIEDVREIRLPKELNWNWVPTVTRTANAEGLGEVTMLELMETALRMRPDRIIVGEIRRKKEAEVLFEAMHTGHSVYSTLHANSSVQVVRRLTEKPLEIPPLEVESIDLLLVQFRDRRTNLRRTYEISEIETGIRNEQLTINTIYKWVPRDDTFEKINPPTKFIRTLNLHTGMTETEIKEDLEKRKTILKWMVENEINDIDEVGKIFSVYYSNPEYVFTYAKNKKDPKDILEELL